MNRGGKDASMSSVALPSHERKVLVQKVNYLILQKVTKLQGFVNNKQGKG